MRWLTISAISSAVGYVGWKIGAGMLSSSNTGLWLSFLFSMVGMWAGMVMLPKNN